MCMIETFKLNGILNPITVYWPSKNPNIQVYKAVNLPGLSVRCSVSPRGVVGPSFSETDMFINSMWNICMLSRVSKWQWSNIFKMSEASKQSKQCQLGPQHLVNNFNFYLLTNTHPPKYNYLQVWWIALHQSVLRSPALGFATRLVFRGWTPFYITCACWSCWCRGNCSRRNLTTALFIFLLVTSTT